MRQRVGRKQKFFRPTLYRPFLLSLSVYGYYYSYYFLCLFSIIFFLFFLRSLLVFILLFPLPPHSLYPSYLLLFSPPATVPPFYFSAPNVHSSCSFFLSLSLWLYSPLDLASFVLSFLILYTVGRTPWTSDQPIARPLPTQNNTNTE
jgi:hypothetical protein